MLWELGWPSSLSYHYEFKHRFQSRVNVCPYFSIWQYYLWELNLNVFGELYALPSWTREHLCFSDIKLLYIKYIVIIIVTIFGAEHIICVPFNPLKKKVTQQVDRDKGSGVWTWTQDNHLEIKVTFIERVLRLTTRIKTNILPCKSSLILPRS